MRILRPAACLSVLLSLLAAGCSSGGSSSNGGGVTTPLAVATTTTLAASASSISTGAALTLTATVTVTGGSAPVPSGGTLTFLDGSTSLGTATTNASGVGTLSVYTLAAGVHGLTATYAGTSAYSTSTSTAVGVTVSVPAIATTITASGVGTPRVGRPLELTANIAAASGTTIPSGTISFLDGGTSIGSATLDATGHAETTVTTLAAGAHTLAASYAGSSTFAASTGSLPALTVPAAPASAFTNPLSLKATSTIAALSCADPATIKAQTSGKDTWYLYCTSDALYNGDPATHYINVFESTDLINWTYDGNAFPGLPSWAPKGQLWAPAVKFMNGQYYMYYTSPSSNADSAGGAAIGVGVSSSPKGPFTDHGSVVVEPEPSTSCCGGADRSTIDPDVIADSTGQLYITFGSFTDGIFVRKLSADGFTSDKSSEVRIADTNRYEGGALWYHGGYYYLFTSSANCCNGPFTGYSVFVGRALTPMGPYVDRSGNSMASVNPGGEEVLAMKGGRWLGPGGNVLFTDEAGQDFMLYHAVDANAPIYSTPGSYTARPALIDPVTWSTDGWPIVDGGSGPSDAPQAVPAAQPAATYTADIITPLADTPGTQIASLSDEFTGTTLSSQWSTLHLAPNYTLANGLLQMPTTGVDSEGNMAGLAMLVENAPATDYVAETKVSINLPVTATNSSNYAQADFFIYGNDTNWLRMDIFASAGTRQIEFINQSSAYSSTFTGGVNGATNLMAPSIAGGSVSAYLRIVKRTVNGKATYTGYSSQDGLTWNRGGTWTATFTGEKIGLAAGNLSGYTVSFDYVHISPLQ